jgi:hypothetical protein
MNTKGPKRYRHPNDIRDAVDRYKAKAQKLRDQAASHDLIADLIRKGENPCSESLAWHREKAKKLRQSAGRIEERQLTKLKQKLAEILTPVLSSMDDGDRSIPVKG